MNLEAQLSGSEYMTLKRQKLDGANEQMPKLSDLFRGLTFYVNGATQPSQNDLRELVCQHGGHFVYHHSGSEVTHVIANQLSTTKLVKLKPSDHVVTPQWVLDCIAQGRRVSEVAYEIARGAGDTADLRAAFGAKKEEPQQQQAKEHKAQDANDPEFLAHYFAASRLHHLSAWRTAFQEELADELGTLDTSSSQHRRRVMREEEYAIIMHVDMDCFFASVAMRHDPTLFGKPIAVCHDSNHGEVSACNYEARKYNVHSGMFVAEARKLCPDLVCVPYQFELYEKTSRALFAVLKRYTQHLEIVSCDEAFIDVSESQDDAWENLPTEDERANAIAAKIRSDIYEATGCHASIGISFNMLLARMATSKAKPNGQFLIAPRDALAFLSPVSVSEIPGVGYKTQKQLKELQIETCGQLQDTPLELLEAKCGKNKAEKLKMYARGVCKRQIEPRRRRKSIGLDVNYGIRFEQQKDVLSFIDRMCRELMRRLQGRDGKQITLKIMLKREDWVAPAKFMGHGRADSKQKSILLDRYVGDLATIASHAKQLYRNFGIKDDTTLVGIGMSLGKLRPVENATEQPPPSLFKEPAPKPKEQLQPDASKRPKYVDLELDELDPETLNELPLRERREIIQAIEERKGKKRGMAPTVAASSKPQVQEAARKQPKRQGKLVVTKGAPPPPVPPDQQPLHAAPTRASVKKEHSVYQTIDSSQIDPATFAELPPDIQALFKAELEEHESKRVVVRKPQKRSQAKREEAVKVDEKKPVVAASVETPVAEQETNLFLGRYSNWRRFFPALLESVVDPDVDELVEAMTRYVLELVNRCNLEDARLFLHDFERHVDSVEPGDEGWRLVWNRVLSTVQQHLIETYGAVLNFELK